jgi:hypothetical protein
MPILMIIRTVFVLDHPKIVLDCALKQNLALKIKSHIIRSDLLPVNVSFIENVHTRKTII